MKMGKNRIVEIIKDIKKLVRAGCSDIIISLTLSKKYNRSMQIEFVKAIRKEYFGWDIERRGWVEDDTQQVYYSNPNYSEFDACKEIGLEAGGMS